jgi:hypothetical protein
MMKNIKYLKTTLLALMIITVSCERELSDDITVATFPSTGDIYTDAPVGLTDAFFISFDPASGANTEGFGVDDNEAYLGASSIRIDVPTPTDSDGGYIGGIFKDRGVGRNLTGYDALTFWVKGSTTATVGTFGFGTDFDGDEYAVTLDNVELSTDWRKVIIPIPDPSKLVQEKGMFLFSAGTQSTNGIGFTFWMDEMRFEKLGTLGQPRPAIQGGQDQTTQANVDTLIPVSGLTYTTNQANGQDVTVSASPSYFDFDSSNPFVASVDETGLVTVDGPGVDGNITSVITATLGGIEAAGSLIVQATDIEILPIYSNTFGYLGGLNIGAFNNADIIIETQSVGNDETILYGNLGFVGMGWDDNIDVSELTHVHLDVQLQSPGSTLVVELISPDDGGGSEVTDQLIENEWVGLDIPLNAFTNPTGGGGTGSPDLENIEFFVLVSNNGTFLIDNIYFYAEN